MSTNQWRRSPEKSDFFSWHKRLLNMGSWKELKSTIYTRLSFIASPSSSLRSLCEGLHSKNRVANFGQSAWTVPSPANQTIIVESNMFRPSMTEQQDYICDHLWHVFLRTTSNLCWCINSLSSSPTNYAIPTCHSAPWKPAKDSYTSYSMSHVNESLPVHGLIQYPSFERFVKVLRWRWTSCASQFCQLSFPCGHDSGWERT